MCVCGVCVCVRVCARVCGMCVHVCGYEATIHYKTQNWECYTQVPCPRHKGLYLSQLSLVSALSWAKFTSTYN